MTITYPHSIENCVGEKIIFHSVVKDEKGDKVIVENYVQPNCGPQMHTHFMQEEGLTVVSGKMGYQIEGQEPRYVAAGENVTFNRGTPHKFWNAGDDVLNCKGWIQPANSVVYFLTALYAAQNKSGNGRPETFDGAYLMARYSKEYDVPGIPTFVKKIIMPIIYFFGGITGKYKHFKDAPAPLR